MNDIEKTQSCITQVTQQEPYLTGENVIVAVLDSGIDYFLPEFRDAAGQTRILATSAPICTSSILAAASWEMRVPTSTDSTVRLISYFSDF